MKNNKIDLEEIGERIALERQRLGWSQNDLAVEAETSVGTIYRIEQGFSTSIEIFTKVCMALGFTPDNIIFGEEKPELYNNKIPKSFYDNLLSLNFKELDILQYIVSLMKSNKRG